MEYIIHNKRFNNIKESSEESFTLFNSIIKANDNKKLSIYISNNLNKIHKFQELYKEIFSSLMEQKNHTLLITALQAGLNPNIYHPEGIPILHRIISYKLQNEKAHLKGLTEIANTLIKYNVDVNTVTKNQQNTIIHCILCYATTENLNNSLQLLKLFLPLLKDPLKNNIEGESPLDLINNYITFHKSTELKNLLLLYEYFNKD